MPRLIFARRVAGDLQRHRDFLVSKNPRAAHAAGETIVNALSQLAEYPERGRPVEGVFRELVVAFANAGYVALYRFQEDQGLVIVTAIRHRKEAGY